MKIGLALGSGSSRGWAHIGIIKALTAQGIIPDIICGASIGSLVGASYVSNNLDKLEKWVSSLTKLETAKFFDFHLSLNGFVDEKRMHSFLDKFVADKNARIENLVKQYAAVATDLETGREVWLTKGLILESVWSSIALPGLFPAIKHNNKWLVDGGLVNPVPISVCHALGADIVIAVNLNGDLIGKRPEPSKEIIKQEPSVVNKLTNFIAEYTTSVFPPTKDEDKPPTLFDAIAGSVNIAQDRITKSRMAGDPPDILLSPQLAHIGMLEFYRASEAIHEGEQCVKRMLPEIKYRLSVE